MAARAVGRPVKIALTRQQMFATAGHRTPTVQRVRLGAGADGRLTAVAADVVEHTATTHTFAEQTGVPARLMYAAPHRRTTHRLARLHVGLPCFMRAPGETPGMFALESAMDELAIAAGVEPVELRLRNVPDVHPTSGRPFSSHGLAACLREGAARFGWDPARPPARQPPGRPLAGRVGASRRRATPPDGSRRPPRSASGPAGTCGSRSGRPTSGRAPGRSSPRSPPTPSACRSSG